MHIQGKVTKIDIKFCTFQIENEINVLAGFYVAHNLNFKFPNINSFVHISDGIIHNKTLILNLNSELKCSNYCSELQKYRCDFFIKLIKNYKLSLLDFVKFVQRIEYIDDSNLFHKQFLKKIKWIESFSFKEIIPNLIPHMTNLSTNQFEISDFKILTPSNYLNYDTTLNLDNQKFVYGVKSFKNNHFLFGYLKVSNHSSYISILDGKYALKCQISYDNKSVYSQTLSQLLNKFVIITNYYIFNEYITDSPTLQYLFVNIRNIQVIHERQSQTISQIVLTSKKCHSVHVKLLNRGIICVKDEKVECKSVKIIKTKDGTINKEQITYKTIEMFQCWLLCDVNYNNECLERKFLVLHGENFEKYPIFNCDDVYIFETDNEEFVKQLKSSNCANFYNLDNKNIPVIKIPQDTKFTFVNNDDSKLTDLTEIRNNFGKNIQNETYSFERTISKRSTAQFLNSEQPKNKNCGLKGLNSQQIVIETQKKDEKTNFEKCFFEENIENGEKLYEENAENFSKKKMDSTTIYLKNWADTLTPLGLIDNMKVAFRFVVNPKNKNYLRTFFYTTVEPLDYCPKKEFQTTSETIGNKDWGPAVSLSDSTHIPAGCLCWGEALTLQFTTLNIQTRCKTCYRTFNAFDTSESVGNCCGAPQIYLTIGLRGRDSSGSFDCVTHELNVLKVLFQMTNNEFQVLEKIFLILKRCTVDFRNEDDTIDLSTDYFRRNCEELLKYMVLTFNRQSIHNFEIKCRKMNKNRNDINANQKWYPIEIRNKIKSNIYNDM